MGVHVLQALEASPVVRPADLTTVAATALPGVPDPPKTGGRQLSVRLLDTYGADNDSVQDHAESLSE